MARDQGGSLLTGVLALLLTVLLAAVAWAGPAPLVDFTASPSTARIDAPVAFGAAVTGIGSGISSIKWEFGDGTTSTYSAPGGYTVSHPYRSTGQRTVRLTATDATGASATATQPVSVIALPSASFASSPSVPVAGEEVTFDGSASSDPAGSLSYSWDFGDGTVRATGTATPAHTYATGGVKTVTLTVTSAVDRREASVSRAVAVNAPPSAVFVYAVVDAPAGQDPLKPVVGQRVAFTAQGSTDADGSITGYAWDLGSGSFGATATVPHLITTFGSAGERSVRVRVTDDRGATATATVPIQVADPAAVTFASASGPTRPAASTTPGAPAKSARKALRGVRVQLTGSVTANRTRVTRMVVRAGTGALVVARCQGPGCPRRDARMRMGTDGSLRIRSLERTLRTGARISITVTRSGFVGRRIILTTRRGRAPARREGCAPAMTASAMTLGPCPRP